MKPLYLFGLWLFIFINNNLFAQERADSIFSPTLHEERYLQIWLPHDYDTTKKYDVLYVLDAEMLGRFIPPIISFEEENELMPPVIVVGVRNNYWYDIGKDSRERDLLPSNQADKFLSFLGKELMPYINSRYSTSDKNILFGHSYGGLFVIYTLLDQPTLFSNYIASDPALWWNEGALLIRAKKQLPVVPHRTTVFIGGRNGAIGAAFGIKEIDSLIKKDNPQIRSQVVFNEDEHHGSVRLKNIYNGLKFTYFGYSSFMLDFFPMGGIVQQNESIPIFLYSTYLDINPGIRYTTNGSEPTILSPRFDYGLQVKAPAILKLKQFSNYGPDKTMSAEFKVGKQFSADNKTNLIAGGLRYVCFNADSISDHRLIASGLLDKDYLPSIKVKGNILCEDTGWFKAEKSGYYTFFLEAGTSCKLKIDKRLLITINPADGINSKSFVVPLAPGFHALSLEFLYKEKDNSISLSYLAPPKKPSMAHLPVTISVKDLYHESF
ncbi:alpha/beta hydrolase-fold protein [Chitinophaga sp. Hz27]|uniref:alpha/beta hydrolase-fold protein n=1 Tax=Chitinophaga sp. Hz27 TaxID=3347169 RepID=UPI0035D92F07